jgi:hypothetical protein
MAGIRRCFADRPDRQPVVARVDHAIIGSEVGPDEGPNMSATPDSTLANPEQLITDLRRQLAESRAEGDEAQRQLAERTIERDEALAQQTATAEVLGVINSSPGDLAPVFDSLLKKALRLCEAAYGNLLVFDGRSFSFASVQGEPDLVEHMRRRRPLEPTPGTALSRIVEGKDVAEIADLLKSHEYHSVPQFRELVDIGGYRSLLEFALRKHKALLGVIAIFVGKPGRSPTSRSRYCRTLQRRPSLQWRMRGS